MRRFAKSRRGKLQICLSDHASCGCGRFSDTDLAGQVLPMWTVRVCKSLPLAARQTCGQNLGQQRATAKLDRRQAIALDQQGHIAIGVNSDQRRRGADDPGLRCPRVGLHAGEQPWRRVSGGSPPRPSASQSMPPDMRCRISSARSACPSAASPSTAPARSRGSRFWLSLDLANIR